MVPVLLCSVLPRSLSHHCGTYSDSSRRACIAILQLVQIATSSGTVCEGGICCLRRRCGASGRHDATSPSQPGSSVRGDDDDGILPPYHQPTTTDTTKRWISVLDLSILPKSFCLLSLSLKTQFSYSRQFPPTPFMLIFRPAHLCSSPVNYCKAT